MWIKELSEEQHSKECLMSSSLAANVKVFAETNMREGGGFLVKGIEFLIITNSSWSCNTSKLQINLSVIEIASHWNFYCDVEKKRIYFKCFWSLTNGIYIKNKLRSSILFHSSVYFYFYSTKIISMADRDMKDILYRLIYFLCKLAKQDKILRKQIPK